MSNACVRSVDWPRWTICSLHRLTGEDESTDRTQTLDVGHLTFDLLKQMTKATPKAAGANKPKKKKKKKTALVICSDRREFWTTQAQFWQWVRDGVVIKTHDSPLTGNFKREHEELMVLLSNTVLNLAHPNHMREALLSRRVGLARK